MNSTGTLNEVSKKIELRVLDVSSSINRQLTINRKTNSKSLIDRKGTILDRKGTINTNKSSVSGQAPSTNQRSKGSVNSSNLLSSSGLNTGTTVSRLIILNKSNKTDGCGSQDSILDIEPQFFREPKSLPASLHVRSVSKKYTPRDITIGVSVEIANLPSLSPIIPQKDTPYNALSAPPKPNLKQALRSESTPLVVVRTVTSESKKIDLKSMAEEVSSSLLN